jgi:hypothetical protein
LQNQRGCPFEFPARALLSKREIGVEEIDRHPVGSSRHNKQIESTALAFIPLKQFASCEPPPLPVPFPVLVLVLVLVLSSLVPTPLSPLPLSPLPLSPTPRPITATSSPDPDRNPDLDRHPEHDESTSSPSLSPSTADGCECTKGLK